MFQLLNLIKRLTSCQQLTEHCSVYFKYSSDGNSPTFKFSYWTMYLYKSSNFKLLLSGRKQILVRPNFLLSIRFDTADCVGSLLQPTCRYSQQQFVILSFTNVYYTILSCESKQAGVHSPYNSNGGNRLHTKFKESVSDTVAVSEDMLSHSAN